VSAARIAVVGAGAFGGWTALALRRRGARVTLLDAWGPGHTRSSSGGETRVIRATYGRHAIYTDMAARAMPMWRAFDAETGGGLFRKTGVLWMCRVEDGFAAASAAALRAANLSVEELTPRDTASRFPQIDLSGVTSALWEPDAGYVFARRACERVVDRFVAEGGDYRQAAIPAPVDVSSLGALEADAFVFACGPWLGGLFPDLVGPHLTVTRQEVYYFGTPAGDTRFVDPAMPVWLDYGDRVMYGIPGNAHRGFKIADDTSGPPMDPTTAPRDVSAAGIAAVRDFMERRFPALRGAPLIGSEVCQYEATPDSDFIIDRHPRAGHVWIAGGGSGHGFKMGPAIAERLASGILDGAALDPRFALSRFEAPPPDGWAAKWS